MLDFTYTYEQYKILWKDAVKYANLIHKASRYDDLPYSTHLDKLDEVLDRFGFDPKINRTNRILRIAGRLHDAIEDGPTSYNKIKERYGEEVAEIDYCLTDELGRTRSERKFKTYPKLRANPDAIILKVADRIANVEWGLATGNTKKFKMYQEEFREFEEQLRIYRHIDDMWDYLRNILQIKD